MNNKESLWEQVRSQFPAACNQVYLMSGSVAPLCRLAYEAQAHHLKMLRDQGSIGWPMELEQLEGARANLARLVGTSSSQLAFTMNASFGMNVLALMVKRRWKEKIASGEVSGTPQIIHPEDEFPASVHPWKFHGFEMVKVPSNRSIISIEEILERITPQTAAVVHSSVQFATGFRQHLKELGESLANRGIPFFVNATQGLGVFPIQLDQWKISGLVASSHKWMAGGFGTGILAASSDFWNSKDMPLMSWLSTDNPMSLDNDEVRPKASVSAVESGTLPFTLIIGLKASSDFILDIGVHAIAERVLELSRYLVTQLQGLKWDLLSARDDEQDVDKTINSGTLLLRSKDPDTLCNELAKRKIYVTARRGGMRVNLHLFNNGSDCDQLCAALKELKQFAG